MSIRWWWSRPRRQAADLLAETGKLLVEQRDLISPEQLGLLEAAMAQTRAALAGNLADEEVARSAEALHQAAESCLKLYPSPIARDNVETLLVVIALAMSIRTFFVQPFRIPTGSMQPTLYGITVKDLRSEPGFVMPGFWRRAWDLAARGVIYHEAIAKDDGAFDHLEPPRSFLGLINKQTVWVRYRGGSVEPITIWGGPEASRGGDMERRVGLDQVNWRGSFRKGEPIIRFEEIAGDHVLVDRLSYNFRAPERGEIVVFKTGHIPQIGQDQFYIKRLIGLPGDVITIGDDRHARVNRVRLDKTTPHFGRIYDFNEAVSPSDSHYSGHILDGNARLKTSLDWLAVRAGHYAVFGDNTVNSWDSRYWGDFPEEDVMGRAGFVYWPWSGRFGPAFAK